VIRAGLIALALLAAGPARADTAERVRAEIQSALPDELSAIEVRLPKALERESAGEVIIDWRPARAGWLALKVRIGERAGWVRARVAAVAPAAIATRDLPAGHVVADVDIRVEMRPAGADAIAGAEGAVGRALRRPVAAGAPLSASALERAAPLPRGHQVTALVRRGRLSVSTAGVLERAAPIGEATSVRLRATGRVVRGRLIDSQTVLIEGSQ
jgi:flagella basal body P-ring formation protein FlgA